MQENVYGVYRPSTGKEMPITCVWHTDGYYHIIVIGADIEILVDDLEAEDEQEAFYLAEEDVARELTWYAFTR